ncbi:hypothetical protein [Streptomyces sp. NPDC057939]|uniref:hypothetical protein n=1 Tax=Streptomyces sp. NPDC057939 TaxID=3346284 RepID=UPI0036F0A46B
MTAAAPYSLAQHHPQISVQGFGYIPRLPPTAYAIFLYLLAQQQPGGLVRATHADLGVGLAVDRGVVSRAMPYLVAARLVKSVGRGRLQLHPMLASYSIPRERAIALAPLPDEERLDVGHFEEEYEQRLNLYQQAKARRKAAAPRKAGRGHLRSVR